MEPLDTLVAGLRHVDSLIDEDVMEPDLGRDDWSTMRSRAKLLYDAVQSELLSALDDALFNVKGDDVVKLIKRRVSNVLGEASAPIFATGDTKSFLSMINKASQIAADDEQRALMDAGSAEPEAFCRLQHARWLQKKGRFKDADRVCSRVARSAERPAIKRAAKKLKEGPRPIDSAPALFRVNGCGTGLYGERDAESDGSYIATYCICLLWIPVFPLTAYRVRRVNENTYQFRTKESLGPVARGFRALLVASAVIAIGWSGVTSYLQSPNRRAEVAMKEAKAAEASGDREGAVQRYRDALGLFEGSEKRSEAAEAVVRLTSSVVTEPATAASVDQIGRVVNGFNEIPSYLRTGAPTTLLIGKMCAWSDQIGEAKVEDASASLSVLDMAAKVVEDRGPFPDIEDRRAKRRRAIADKVAGERPVYALQNYTKISDPPALDAAKAILDTFGDAPSLWIYAEPDVDRFVDASQKLGRDADAAMARKNLRSASLTHKEDEAVIESGDEKALVKALAARPGDQELAVALAGRKRERGEVKDALATLTKLGAPGRMTADAQALLAQCESDMGDLEKADQVLTAFLRERLPVFQAAQREYMEATQKMRDSIVSAARMNRLPADLENKLRGVPESEQAGVFSQYIGERVNGDPELSRLRSEYLRHVTVVPASLTFGMVKLRRAREATGDARRELLSDAERAFLSIRQEAEGEPSFHLGLGQVYHRLGRADDGDKELQGVLERKDDMLSLSVAHVYRELGRVERAKQIAERVYAEGRTEDSKFEAALIRAHMNDGLADEEAWLKRSDTSSPTVRNMLDENEAGRLAEAGKAAEADRAYAKVIAWHERSAKTDPAAANNAAVGYMTRYTITGDIAHIKSAVAHLETSVRLSGDNAITLGHLSDALQYLGLVNVASKWVQMKTLMLDSADVASLIDMMLDGPLHAEVLDALSKEPSYRRALELTKQEQILAPEKVTSYLKQSRWLRWSDDEAGLAELEKRLAAMPAMKSEDTAEGRRAFAAGEKDAEMKRSMDGRLARAREALARAQKEGNKPTIAAAWLALSDSLVPNIYWNSPSAPHDERVSACRSAHEAWPEGVSESELAGSLLLAAVVKGAAANEAFNKRWIAERRTFNVMMILARAMAEPGGDDIKAALRKLPELGEAARLRKTLMADKPTMTDWQLARVAGDADMEQAAAKAFERRSLELALKIDVLLFAGQEREKAEMDFFVNKGKLSAAP